MEEKLSPRASDIILDFADAVSTEAAERLGARGGERRMTRGFESGYEVWRGGENGCRAAVVVTGRERSSGSMGETTLFLRGVLGGFVSGARSVLCAGIGNRLVGADSLGASFCSRVTVGSHGGVSVFAISPGTPAQTGADTASLIRAAASELGADLIVTVDSLSTSSPERLCSLVQIDERGITPGSAMTHTSGEISRATMPCRVVSVGVPTAVVLNGIMLTTADIAVQTEFYSTVLASALSAALIGK